MNDPIAEQRIRKALALIQEAQNLVGQAAQQLCPVRGIGNLWNDTGKLHDRVKDHWYRVEGARQRGRADVPADYKMPAAQIGGAR